MIWVFIYVLQYYTIFSEVRGVKKNCVYFKFVILLPYIQNHIPWAEDENLANNKMFNPLSL
jgi:hypothetical protein